MSIEQNNFQGIRTWNEDDRPREKLLLKGKASLSDAELLAIILGSGSKNEDAVQLAKRILQTHNNSLNTLGQQSIDSLKQFKGVGEAKAISIVAAMELGRRKKSVVDDFPKISVARDAFNILYPFFEDLLHEEFRILLLNRANKVFANILISSGGVSGTVVDAKIIFREALLKTASGIILSHNHPSGNLNPSSNDLKITKSLIGAAQFLDISLLDHIIIGKNAFYSFAEHGLLN